MDLAQHSIPDQHPQARFPQLEPPLAKRIDEQNLEQLRSGSKRPSEITAEVNREITHVDQVLLMELGINGNLDGSRTGAERTGWVCRLLSRTRPAGLIPGGGSGGVGVGSPATDRCRRQDHDQARAQPGREASAAQLSGRAAARERAGVRYHSINRCTASAPSGSGKPQEA